VGLISGLLDRIGHGALDLAADGMNLVGMPGTGLKNAVDELVDGSANGPELQLGQTDEPTQLIHGDPGAINGMAGQLDVLSRALGQTAQGLSEVESPTWDGAAADKFRAVFGKQPHGWQVAQAACANVAGALNSWAAAVTSAQSVAAQAIDAWNEGNALSAQPHEPSSDPGAGLRQQAVSMLSRARAQRDQKAAATAAAIRGATDTAPAEPSLVDRAFTDLLDSDRSLISEGESFVGGVLLAAGGTAKALRSIDSIDSARSPKDVLPWLGSVSGYDLLQHPKDAVASVENQVESARRNPMQAVGEAATLAVPGADEIDAIRGELAVSRAADLARIAEWGKAVRGAARVDK
jgi:uncharacterized protein YukE